MVGSTHALISLRLLISFAVLILSRILFIIFNNRLLGSDLPFGDFIWMIVAGLRYDFSALMMINGLWVFVASLPFSFRNKPIYRFMTDWLYFVPNIAAFTVNMIDIAYFPFTLRRTTGDVFNYLTRNDAMSLSLIPDFIINYWYIVLLWLAIGWISIRLVLLIRVDNKLTFSNRHVFLLWNAPVWLLWTGLVIIGIRGGFQLKPVSVVNAATVAPAQQIPGVLNTPFVMMKTLKNNRLQNKNYMPANEAVKLFNPDQQVMNDTISGTYRDYNLMVILLESFSLEHTAAGGEKSFTPFLDSLARHSLYFRAHANGKRSIEAIPAVVASLPTWMDYDFISSPYAANQINSLPSLLKPLGYTSMFFHGGNNGTMSFNAFCNLAGFDSYYGRDEYHNDDDFDGKWGIWDERFYDYTARVLQSTPQPFFATFFSLSSHHPYKIPDQYEGRFPDGKIPIQKAIAYGDFALRTFFEKTASMDWYKKTIFVITADHTSEGASPYFQTRAGQYDIPLLLFCPEGLPPTDTAVTVQQTDIMPTLLYLLGYKGKFTAFGSNIYDSTANRFAMNYAEGNYQFFSGNTLLRFANDQTNAYYNLSDDRMQEKNRVKAMSTKAFEDEQLMKSVIQQYNDRMNLNQLVPK